MKLRYLRLERPSTQSWMTYRLPTLMNLGTKADAWAGINSWVKANLPGWELVSGCTHNPDYEEGLPEWEPAGCVMPPVKGDQQ